MLVLTAAAESLRVLGSHRLATCWKIVRKDGVTLRFTTHDATLTVPIKNHTETFTPVAAVAPSARQKLSQLQQRNVEVKGVVDADNVSYHDLDAGKYRGAVVTEVLVNWQYPWAGIYGYTEYHMGETRYNGEYWECALEGKTTRLKQEVGRTFGRLCDAKFGDSLTEDRCKLVKATFTHGPYAVTATGDGRTRFNSTTVGVDDFFSAGEVEWLTGLNAGVNYDVQDFLGSGGAVHLMQQTQEPIQVGDTFDIVEGCDHTLATCRDRFDNLVNFRGFPYVPGTDLMIQTPNAKS